MNVQKESDGRENYFSAIRGDTTARYNRKMTTSCVNKRLYDNFTNEIGDDSTLSGHTYAYRYTLCVVSFCEVTIFRSTCLRVAKLVIKVQNIYSYILLLITRYHTNARQS